MRFLATISFASLLTSGVGQAKLPQQTEELLQKLRKFEKSERKNASIRADKVRRKAIAELEKIAAGLDKDKNARQLKAIQREIDKIKHRLSGVNVPEKKDIPPVEPKEPAAGNKFFHVGVPYSFKHDIKKFSGTVTFLANNTANMEIREDGQGPVKVIWHWKNNGDHIALSGNDNYGPIFVSEIVGDEKNSIMVRWGGKLRNKTTKATK